jgi:hypothetical protein
MGIAKLVDKLVKKRQRGRPAPTFKGMAGLPRQLVPFTFMRRPMTAGDKRAYSAPLDPMPRLVATLVFTLFSLYPTLVSSIAKIVNCSDPVGGTRYLHADMSVTCYEGWHLVYLGGAALCFVVYCIGIPVLIFVVTILKTPCVFRRKITSTDADHPAPGGERDNGEAQVDAANGDAAGVDGDADEANAGVPGGDYRNLDEDEGEIDALARGRAPCHSSEHHHYYCPIMWRCVRRSPLDYARREVRVRFGFLFHGYETDGRAIVVGWEASVMMRKLFVTLAGAGLSDVRRTRALQSPARHPFAPALALTRPSIRTATSRPPVALRSLFSRSSRRS